VHFHGSHSIAACLLQCVVSVLTFLCRNNADFCQQFGRPKFSTV